MFLAGQVSRLVENFNIEIYSAIIDVVKVKLFMMVLLAELYLSYRFQCDLEQVFKITAMLNNLDCRFCVFIQLKLKPCRIVK